MKREIRGGSRELFDSGFEFSIQGLKKGFADAFIPPPLQNSSSISSADFFDRDEGANSNNSMDATADILSRLSIGVRVLPAHLSTIVS